MNKPFLFEPSPEEPLCHGKYYRAEDVERALAIAAVVDERIKLGQLTDVTEIAKLAEASLFRLRRL